MASSEQPLCPACGSSGPEATCPACQVDRLIPDSQMTEEDFEQAIVNEEFMNVFRAYQAVVEGRGTLVELVGPPAVAGVLPVGGVGVGGAIVDRPPDDQERETLFQAVTAALEGVHRMHAVKQNRQTRELHQGWVQIFRGAKALYEETGVAVNCACSILAPPPPQKT